METQNKGKASTGYALITALVLGLAQTATAGSAITDLDSHGSSTTQRGGTNWNDDGGHETPGYENPEILPNDPLPDHSAPEEIIDTDDVLVIDDPVLDATGTQAYRTVNKQAQTFRSSSQREMPSMAYQQSADATEGGGTSGGFPYWVPNDDWEVEDSAQCNFFLPPPYEVAGIKTQSLGCEIEDMNGDKSAIGNEHCEVGAHNTKPPVSKVYTVECPAPEWVTDAAINPWELSSGWSRTASDRGATCGTITEVKTYSREAICDGGTTAECQAVHGAMNTSKTETRTVNLGTCTPEWSAWKWSGLPISTNSGECPLAQIADSNPDYQIKSLQFHWMVGMCYAYYRTR